MAEAKNIHQRVISIREKVRYVQKDVTVTSGGSYKAVSHDAVVAAVRKAMDEEGVVLKVEYDKERSEVDIDQWKEGERSRLRVFMRCIFVATFINADSPEDVIILDVPAHAIDFGGMAPGKAMSYAKKYALLHLFLLETGEEEESRAAEVDEVKLEMALAQIAANLKADKPLEALAIVDQGELTIGEKIKLNGWLNSHQKKALRDARQEQVLAKLQEKQDA